MSGGGRLTCHVLDVTRGLPAAGMGMTLSRPDGGVVVETTTNADGRSEGALLAGDDLEPGSYLLTFAVGAFFAGRDGVSSPPFYDVVPIRFTVTGTTDHLHIALLVSPWSYTTYRGS